MTTHPTTPPAVEGAILAGIAEQERARFLHSPFTTPPGEAVSGSDVDLIALEAAREIADMWGNDRSQFVSKIQVRVTAAIEALAKREATIPWNGGPICVECGKPTMHMGNVCFFCSKAAKRGAAPDAAQSAPTPSVRMEVGPITTPAVEVTDARDAARYRWLRANLLWAKSYDGYVRWSVEIDMPAPGICEDSPPIAYTLDRAIDAALTASRKGG